MDAPPTPKTSPGSTKATIGQNMSEGMNFQHKTPSLDVTTEEFSTSTLSTAGRNGTNVPPCVEQSSGKRSRSRRQPKEKNVAIDNVRIKLEQSEKDLKASRGALEEANATIKGQETIINSLKSDASLLQDQKEAQSETMKSMRETVSKMEEDHQKQKDELMAVTAGTKELEAQKELVENARGKDKAQHLKALEDLRRSHQAEKKALEDSRSDQQAKATEQIKKLEAEKKAAESGRCEAQKRYIEAAAKLQSLHDEKDKIERKSSDLLDQISWHEIEKEALEQSNSYSQRLGRRNVELKAEKTELETTVESLEQSKSSAEETIAKQAKELTEWRAEVRNLNKVILRVKEEKEALASLEAKRKIMLPIRIVLALLFLLLTVSLWKL
jgi:chromosome segregation ATPase